MSGVVFMSVADPNLKSEITDPTLRKSTICPSHLDLFYIVNYYTKWVKTSWTCRGTPILSLKGEFKFYSLIYDVPSTSKVSETGNFNACRRQLSQMTASIV